MIRDPLLDPHVKLPQIPEVILVEEALIPAEGEIGQVHPAGIVSLREAMPRDRVVLLADAEAVEVEVATAEGDPEDPVQVGERAIGPDQDAAPKEGVDVPDTDVDRVGLGCGGRVYGTAMVSGQSPAVAFAPGLKCSPDSVSG